MTKKQIVFFLIALVLLLIAFWPTGGLKIVDVIDGNTIELDNGSQVRLIGISCTTAGKEELMKAIGEKIELDPDTKNDFDPKNLDPECLYYAYVLLADNNYEDLGASLLKKRKASLVEDPYLNERLNEYRKYSTEEGGVQPDPQPKRQEIPLIDYSTDSIKLPPYTMPSERIHHCWYADGNQNIPLLEEACDYNLNYTKMFANQLAAKTPGEFSLKQVCSIYNYCYKKWRYVNDPKGQEYVARASESIAGSLCGDCDDYAVLMTSCILACGGDACVTVAYGPKGGHAYSEVDIMSFSNSNPDFVSDVIRSTFASYNPGDLHVRKEGNHIWLNLDWQAAYPGGPYFEATERHHYSCIDGQWNYNN